MDGISYSWVTVRESMLAPISFPDRSTWTPYQTALERELGTLWRAWELTIDPLSELAREKIWSRIHLIPLLQAEEDRDQARRYYADKAREKELLGTDSKVYNSDRYGYSPLNIVESGIC